MVGKIGESCSFYHDVNALFSMQERRAPEWMIGRRNIMANLIQLDPFKILRGGDPFTEFLQMQREMGRLFGQIFGGNLPVPKVAVAGEWTPLVETYMKGDNLIVKCELPGVDPKDVDVTFDESAHQLVIKGERKQDKEAKVEDYIYRELAYGKFERRFTLPTGVKIDQMKAKYTDGILEITVPSAAEAKPKKIQIEMPGLLEGEKAEKKAA
jgi:HSP20 family protein